ncbi:MAG: DUF547 domain-containing protein [Cyanobacteria bacterium J06638_22]
MRYSPVAFLLPAAILIGGCSTEIAAPSGGEAITASATEAAPFDYSLYTNVLESYVDEDGLVDYVALQANSEDLLAFNESLGDVAPETFHAWSREEQLAFLLNAYNSFTLQSIIDQDPLKDSIRDIPGVWRVRRFDIAGASKTLDNIEHDTIRPDYEDPRIHAAVNCSAISCPVLRREPYVGENLDAQLEEQVQIWIDGTEGVEIDRENNVVHISELFNWFGEDWIPDYGDTEEFAGNDKERAALNFISQQVSAEDAAYLREGNYEVRYLYYDWALNIQS